MALPAHVEHGSADPQAVGSLVEVVPVVVESKLAPVTLAPLHERMLSGVAAAFVALGVAQLAGTPFGTRANARVAIGSVVVDLTPGPIKDWAIHTMGSLDKLFVAVVALVAIATIAAIAGALETPRHPLGSAAIAAAGVLGCSAVLSRHGATALDTIPTVAGAACGVAALRFLTRRFRSGVRGQENDHDVLDAGRRRLVTFGLLGLGAASGAAGAAITRFGHTTLLNTWADHKERDTSGVHAIASDASRLVVAPSGDTTGVADLAAINAAIGSGSVAVQLEAGTYYVNAPIVLQKNTHLVGVGMRATTIRLVDSANCNVVQNFVSPDGVVSNGEFVAIRDMTIDGNNTHQNSTSYGIHFATNPQWSGAADDECYDPHNEVSNVFIVNTRNDAVNTYGRGEHRFTNVVAYQCWGNGFNIGGSDTFLVACTAGNMGLAGFNFDASGFASLSGCKAFVCGTATPASGTGFNVHNSHSITMSSCHAQDNQAYGFALDTAEQVTLTGCLADSNSGAGVGAYTGLYLNNASYNSVTGFISTERRYDGTHSFQQNALLITGACSGNDINLTHSPTLYSSATVGAAIKRGSVKLTGNRVVINGVS
jgi:hypothetical protein